MRNDKMELKLSQTIRKNLTIRSLSMILGDMVTELQNDKDLNIYTGNLEEIQTLLDCILDESSSNDKDLSKFQSYLENIEPFPTDNLGTLEMDDLIAVENLLKLPEISLYGAIQEVRSKTGGKA